LEQHRIEHNQRVYRASRGAHYDEGGSSGALNVPQMRRSATVRENSSRGFRNTINEQLPFPGDRLRAVEVELENDQMRTKQFKITTSWFKKAQKKMAKAWESFMIDTNVLFTMVDFIY